MKFDLIIIGGGMAGATLACSLKNTSLRIGLVDASSLAPNTDNRLIALNFNSCSFFKELNLWQALSPHTAAIAAIHVSHRGHFGSMRLTAEEVDLPVLGYVVPAKEINAVLDTELNTLKNLTLFRPAKLISIAQHQTGVTLALDSGETLDTALVIAADGTHSTVRELLSIPTEVIDYQQQAIVTVTDLKRDHQHIAYERFLAKGAIAMLPLAEKQVATIWSDDKINSDRLLSLSDADFLQELQTQFGYRLGQLQHVHPRAAYPLKLVQAKQQRLDRVLLIGNAAHTLHPIAAQGLNLALHEIACLAKHFASETQTFPDLKLYQKQQQNSINLSHRLVQLFSSDFFMLETARQLGLLSLDACIPAKKHFIKRAIFD